MSADALGAEPAPGGVSVAMATFNGARYLPEQLASLTAQRLAPAELVVVDDASSDGTVEVLEAFRSTAPFPVRITRHDRNQGWGASFIEAISACSAAYVAPCDQDDVWHPDKLARCTEWFSSTPELALVVHSCRVVDAQLRPLGSRQPDFRHTRVIAPEQLPLGFAHHGMALVFPRWLFTGVDHRTRPLAVDRGSPHPMNHDTWIGFLACLAGPVALLAEELCDYRRHGANASNLKAQLGGSRGLAGLFHAEAKAAAYRVLASRHEAIASYLDHLRPAFPATSEAVLRARVTARAGLHRRAAVTFGDRACVIDPGRWRGARLRALAAMLAAGGYGRRERGGLGATALGIDLAVAIATKPTHSAQGGCPRADGQQMPPTGPTAHRR